MYKQGDTIALPIGLAGRGYIAVSTVFGRNAEGQSTLLIEVSRSSLWRTDYWKYSSWHVKLVHHSKHCLVCAGYLPFFYIFCRQDALYLCFRRAGTARNQGQQWAVACLGVRRCSIYPVGAGKDPCISFLDSSSNHISLTRILNLQVPVAARSKAWVCGRSVAGIVGLNPAGSIDVCLL